MAERFGASPWRNGARGVRASCFLYTSSVKRGSSAFPSHSRIVESVHLVRSKKLKKTRCSFKSIFCFHPFIMIWTILGPERPETLLGWSRGVGTRREAGGTRRGRGRSAWGPFARRATPRRARCARCQACQVCRVCLLYEQSCQACSACQMR